MANTKIQSEQIEDDIALGGNPTTTTQSAGNNTTRVATTAFVTTAVANLVDSAPSALDTLNELAAAMNDNASFFSTVLPLSGGTMTGNISHASDFTLDMGGEINLDADGGKIRFKDAGTEHLRFVMDNSGALQMYAAVADVDLKIQGLDGSSVIDALMLDMADGGTATFNSHIRLGDNKTASFGAGFDIEITSDGTNGTIAAPNGNLTVDVAGEIILDSDAQGSGNGILLKDAGLHYGSIFRSSSHLHLKAETQDKNLLFLTNNGGSELTAMTIQSDGNVGIGTTSPKRHLHINNSASASTKIQITNGATGSSSDGDGLQLGIGNDATAYLEQRENADLVFTTNNTEAMRIDSSRNLLVGTTDVSQYNNASGADHGTVIGASSFIDISRNGNPMLYLNRTDSEGQLAYFSQEGSGKGALSTRSGLIWLETVTSDGSDTSGVVLDGGAGNGSTSRGALVAAYGNENSNYPGQINLVPGASGKIQTFYGASATTGAAFNSSGNLTFPSGKGIDFSATANTSATGASMSSELFDDYERGTWTPVISHNDGSGAIPLTVTNAEYIKIGKLVYVRGYLVNINPNGNAGTSSPYYGITGLPFASSYHGTWHIAYASNGITSYGGYTSSISFYFLIGSQYGLKGQGHVSGTAFNAYGSGLSLMFDASYITSA